MATAEAGAEFLDKIMVKPGRTGRPAALEVEERTPRVVTLRELLATEFPPREVLLDPWLSSQSLVMVHAWRGVGKTHFNLGVGYALASGGSFLGWKAVRPVRVLYLDGEMPGHALLGRVAAMVGSNDHQPPDGFLKFLTPDLQVNGVMPDLATNDGQRAVAACLGDAEVIVVDNISCLVRSGKENEAEGWVQVAEWALRMRASGRSVLFVHHSGKAGQQRGTSKREDLLDTVIALKRPADYDAKEGARFEIHFEKARSLYGQDVEPIEATLTTADGRQSWSTRTVEGAADTQMIELATLGLSQAEIARELGVHRSTVLRALDKARQEGRYTPAKKKSKDPLKLILGGRSDD